MKRGGDDRRRGTQGDRRPDQRGRRTPPPDMTFNEAEFIRNAKERKSVLEFSLTDGTSLRGTITYFDRDMIKIAPDEGPTLFVRKRDIRTISDG